MPTMEKYNLLLEPWLKDEAVRFANQRGITLAEYIRDAMKVAVREDQQREMEHDGTGL